jgi:putative tricarboxylic transport membrane protein
MTIMGDVQMTDTTQPASTASAGKRTNALETRLGRRPLLSLLAAAGSAAGLGRRPAAAATWPTGPITIVVTTKAGGGFDHLARSLAPALSRELGVPVNVLDKAGGAMLLGTEYFLNQEHNGNTLLISGPSPYWYFDMNKFHASFHLSDFDVINVQWTDKSAVFVPKAGRFQSFRSIIDAIKAHPGTVSCGVVRDSGEYFNSRNLIESIKLPPSAVRLVTYEASAPLRTALAGNQLDYGVVSAEASLGMLGLLNPVAVFNDVPIPALHNAPTVSDVLKADGVTVDYVPSSMRALITYADLKTKHPDQYARLLGAYRKVLQDPTYLASARKQGIGTDWLGQEKSLAEIKSAYTIFDKHKSLLVAQ